MLRVSGRVVVQESAAPVANVKVAAFDVAAIASAPAEPVTAEQAMQGGVSVGSAVTSTDGSFVIQDEAGDRGQPGRELFLIVRGPESEAAPDGWLLYASPAARRSSATAEEFLIAVSAATLAEASLAVPLGVDSPALEDPGATLHTARESVKRGVAVEEEMRSLVAAQVDKRRKAAETVANGLRPKLLEELLGPKQRRGYLPPDATDADKAEAMHAAREAVNRRRAPVVSYIQVPAREVPQAWRSGAPVQATPEAVEPYLFGALDGDFRAAERVRQDPVALARARAVRPASLADAIADDPGVQHSAGPAGDGLADAADPALDGLPAYVDRLLSGMAPPEAVPGTARPDPENVQHATDAFSLRSGPADVPAVYDFHHLQIAFDHVWTHVVDQDLLRITGELSHHIVAAGGNPLAAVSAGASPTQALRSEVQLVQDAPKPTIITRPDPAPKPPNPKRPKYPGSVTAAEGVRDIGDGWTPPPLHELLGQLDEILAEPYKFEIFAPGSVNYGINVTYRQRWVPLTYQVGDLAKTITLAPRESRKIITKRVRRKERIVREMENSLRVRKDESSETGRDESEIVRKAQQKTSFSLTADGSYDLLIADGDTKTSFTKDATEDSAETKKAFREAVRKAAQEFKDERKLEVESKEFEEVETTESTEIQNPNDELTVTYLFYELQRRFMVSEQLHRIMPVVLVAMEVPSPDRRSIDKVLLTHSWIINRVMLDDRYRPALTYLTTTVVGDELALNQRWETVNGLRLAVQALQRNHAALVAEVQARNTALAVMMEQRAVKVAKESGEGVIEDTVEFVFGQGANEDVEAARIREENARAQYEKAVREEQELRDSLRSETAALNQATSEYAAALAAHANHLLEVAALRVHFKANLLYYMQAIWSHTFSDQLQLSVHRLEAPTVPVASASYTVEHAAALPAQVVPKPGHLAFKVTADKSFLTAQNGADDVKTIAEIADPTPLGFFGNYMILRLKQSNPLTDFMMTPYVDAELGAHDPDELGNWTPEDFVAHVKALRATMAQPDFDEIMPTLDAQYRRIITAPRRAEEEIVVPSDSLYIEALPGTRPNLEDFKLRHRAADVNKVRAEVRRIELENLRYAGRILTHQFDDPEIDKQVRVEGNGAAVVVPAES